MIPRPNHELAIEWIYLCYNVWSGDSIDKGMSLECGVIDVLTAAYAIISLKLYGTLWFIKINMMYSDAFYLTVKRYSYIFEWGNWYTISGIILGMGPANERQCYNVTSSLIGWAYTQNDSCIWVIPAVSWRLLGVKSFWKLKAGSWTKRQKRANDFYKM